MSYYKKQYGNGFKILGKYEGWDYGIWEESLPSEFVFLKKINEEDFVFCSMKTENENLFCGILKKCWTKCIDGNYQEIDEKEAQMLLQTKMNRYDHIPKVKEGDAIYVLNRSTGEFEKAEVKDIYYGEYGILIGYEGACSQAPSEDGYEKADDYRKTWKLEM